MICNRDLSPVDFEKWCAERLRGLAQKEGIEIEVVHDIVLDEPDGDFQIDIMAETKLLSFPFTILCECKHYSSRVKREKVELLRGRLQSTGANKGILFSTSGFQEGAISYANVHGISLVQVNPLEDSWEVVNDCKRIVDDHEDVLSCFVQKMNYYESQFLRSIIHCDCKWGTYSLDKERQNANACEGLLAVLFSKNAKEYKEIICEATEYLVGEASENGIQSKSLHTETVVPTSLYLYACGKQKLNSAIREKNASIARKLWEVRSSSGWGMYVKNMDSFSTIGATFWALMSVSRYNCIATKEFQQYLLSLFKYEDAYGYGKTIDEVNLQLPSIYSTSMMYILFSLLSKESRKKLGKRYNPERAIKFILDGFDNELRLIEIESIGGINESGKTTIHTTSWQHISFHYSLWAISIAIKNGAFSEEELYTVLGRINQILAKTCERDGEWLLWTAPNFSLDGKKRGKIMYPTMHALIAVTRVREAIERYIKLRRKESE